MSLSTFNVITLVELKDRLIVEGPWACPENREFGMEARLIKCRREGNDLQLPVEGLAFLIHFADVPLPRVV